MPPANGNVSAVGCAAALEKCSSAPSELLSGHSGYSMSIKHVAAMVGAVSAVLVMHGTVPQPTCLLASFDCPEPEQRPDDMPEHGRPSGPPTTYSSRYAMVGPTGPSSGMNISPRSGEMGFVSFAPRVTNADARRGPVPSVAWGA
jgi:hypothetical protein